MSSLRLALKQSLEEAGPQLLKKKKKNRRSKQRGIGDGGKSSSRKKKKRGPGRPRKDEQRIDSSDNDDDDNDNNNNDNEDRHHDDYSRGSTKSGTGSDSNDGDGESSSGDDSGSGSSNSGSSSGSSSSSDENEFSDASTSSDDDDDDDDTQHTSSVQDVGESTSALFQSDSSSENEEHHHDVRKQKKAQKKQKRQHTKNTAANRIQNQWKKKKKSKNPATSATAGGNGSTSPQHHHHHHHHHHHSDNASPSNKYSPLKKQQQQHHNDDDDRHHHHNHHQSGSAGGERGGDKSNNDAAVAAKKKWSSTKKSSSSSKKKSSTKARTVIPPSGEAVSWMHSLSVDIKRKNIAAGHRVKVRFVTKVKREGKQIRKLKWYGGLVTGVSTGGSKIRIKYDDGTSEIAKFPDKDIVVDDEGNDFHRVNADVFLPPTEEEEEDDDDEEEQEEEEEEEEEGEIEEEDDEEEGEVRPPASALAPAPAPVQKRFHSPFYDDDTDVEEDSEQRKEEASPKSTLPIINASPTNIENNNDNNNKNDSNDNNIQHSSDKVSSSTVSALSTTPTTTTQTTTTNTTVSKENTIKQVEEKDDSDDKKVVPKNESEEKKIMESTTRRDEQMKEVIVEKQEPTTSRKDHMKEEEEEEAPKKKEEAGIEKELKNKGSVNEEESDIEEGAIPEKCPQAQALQEETYPSDKPMSTPLPSTVSDMDTDDAGTNQDKWPEETGTLESTAPKKSDAAASTETERATATETISSQSTDKIQTEVQPGSSESPLLEKQQKCEGEVSEEILSTRPASKEELNRDGKDDFSGNNWVEKDEVGKDESKRDQMKKGELKKDEVSTDDRSTKDELREDKLEKNEVIKEKRDEEEAETGDVVDEDESKVTSSSLSSAVKSHAKPSLHASHLSETTTAILTPQQASDSLPAKDTGEALMNTEDSPVGESEERKSGSLTGDTDGSSSREMTKHSPQLEAIDEKEPIAEEKRSPKTSKPSLTIRLSAPKSDKQKVGILESAIPVERIESLGDNQSKQEREDDDGVPSEELAADVDMTVNVRNSQESEPPALGVEVSTEAKDDTSGGVALAGTKRPQQDSLTLLEEPIPKKRHKAQDEEQKPSDIPVSLLSVEAEMDVDEASSEPKKGDTGDSSVPNRSNDTSAETKENIPQTETISPGSSQSDEKTQTDKQPEDVKKQKEAQSPSSPLLEEKRKREDEGSEERPSSRPALERQASSGSGSLNESPTPLSADLKQSTSDVELSKPVSKMATTVRLEASEMQDKVKDGPVLTGSKNSAFDRKESAQPSSGGDEQLEPVCAKESGADLPHNDVEEATFSRSSPFQEHASVSKTASSIPMARSGRRAAQQANQRIVAKERVIEDPFVKNKKKKDKLEVKPPSTQPHSSKDGKRKRELDDSDEEDDRQWVQCDSCQKWRVLPKSVRVDSLPKHWYCEMNEFDPAHNTCDAPEQSLKEVAKTKKRKKKRGPRAKSPTEIRDTQEDQEEGVLTADKDSRSEKVKERSLSRSPLTIKKEKKEQKIASPKPKRCSPTITTSSPDSTNSDSGRGDQKTEKSKKTTSSSSGSGKKAKHDKTDEGGTEESGEAVSNRGSSKGKKRGRKEKDSGGKDNDKDKGKSGSKGDKELENHQEWVMCEKCEKWRKLPKHIKAKDLPDVWYCSMNTWDSNTSSCSAKEDKVDPNTREFNMFGSTGNSGGSTGKLSYRNLIFGTGRKQNRPISERTRAAESLFNPIVDDEADSSLYPTTVMYANSSAFVCKGSNASKFGLDGGGEGRLSFFDLMNRSHLWAELRGGMRSHPANGIQSKSGQSNPSFDELPDDIKCSLREIVAHALGTKTLAGHEVLFEVQLRNWDNIPPKWAEVRALCTIDLVMAVLFEFVKNGDVQMLKGTSNETSINGTQVARYRRVVKADPDPRSSRCMKIAKPWRKSSTSSSGQSCN